MGRQNSEKGVRAKVTLQSKNRNIEKEVEVEGVADPVGDLKAFNWRELSQYWPHLKTLRFPQPVGDGEVSMIIGTNTAFFHQCLREVVGESDDDPIARLTPLGWSCIGKILPVRTQGPHTAVLGYAYKSAGLYGQPEPVLLNYYDRLSMRKLNESTRTLPDGRLEVPVLWRGDTQPPPNYEAARRMYESFEQRVLVWDGLWSCYNDNIEDWRKKGYVRIVQEGKRDGYFLPHFAVPKPGKPDKVRVVMNGKAEFSGTSLNDHMTTGPKLINSLHRALLRFRRYPVGIVGDIKEMFLRLKLPPEDRRYHRFVYRAPGQDEIQTYEFLSHVFGSAGLPGSAIGALKLAAKRMEAAPGCQAAAEAILEGSIVDDICTSVQTEAEGRELVRGLITICQRAGMEFHKWASNCPEILPTTAEVSELVELKDETMAAEIPEEKKHMARPLGIFWRTNTDILTFFFY